MINEMSFEKDHDPCPSVEWDNNFDESVVKSALEKLISFSEGEGVEVVITHNEKSRYSPEQNIIFLNAKYGVRRMYYTLLHELGHFSIFKNLWDGEDGTAYLIHYPGFVGKSSVPYSKNGYKFKRFWFSRIHEELDAWRKGIDIAAMLMLPLSLYEYTDRASKSVFTYFYQSIESV